MGEFGRHLEIQTPGSDVGQSNPSSGDSFCHPLLLCGDDDNPEVIGLEENWMRQTQSLGTGVCRRAGLE